MRHRISQLNMQPRYLMTAICVAVLLFFFLGTGRAYAQEIRRVATDQIKGDVNGDGYVNMNDVTFIINIILGKTSGEDEEDDGIPPVGDDDANPGLPVLMPKK